eukprot:4499380-Pleurochrysis_carterae.AAC.2
MGTASSLDPFLGHHDSPYSAGGDSSSRMHRQRQDDEPTSTWPIYYWVRVHLAFRWFDTTSAVQYFPSTQAANRDCDCNAISIDSVDLAISEYPKRAHMCKEFTITWPGMLSMILFEAAPSPQT